MGSKTNRQRAKQALRAVRAYPTFEAEDLESSIVDLVADLLHLANNQNFVPADICQIATDHYVAEMEEEEAEISISVHARAHGKENNT